MCDSLEACCSRDGQRTDLKRVRTDCARMWRTWLTGGYGGASGPGSAGAVLHRIVDDDCTTGGVIGDIGSHLLALRRRPRRGHCRSVSELGLEDREVRRLSLRRCDLEAVAPREQARHAPDQREVVAHVVVAEVVGIGGLWIQDHQLVHNNLRSAASDHNTPEISAVAIPAPP